MVAFPFGGRFATPTLGITHSTTNEENVMKNATPKTGTPLDEKIAAQPGGKSLVICGYGQCRVCRKKSPDVAVTRPQLLRWFGANQQITAGKTPDPEWTKGFLKWEIIALQTGLHRECQPVAAKKDRDKARAEMAREARKAEAASAKVEKAVAKKRGKKVLTAA